MESKTGVPPEVRREEVRQLQEAYTKMMRDRMNMAVHPAMNAAQGSILGGLSSQVGTQMGQIHQYQGERRVESVFDHNRQVQMNVVTADNGYILILKTDNPAFLGGSTRILVANTIDELRDLITSEMVTRKMEK